MHAPEEIHAPLDGPEQRWRKKLQQRADERLLRDTCEQLSADFLRDLDSIYRHHRPALAFIARSFRALPNKQFDADKLTLFCADLSGRLDNAQGTDHQAVWVNGMINTPLLLAEELLKLGLLLYKQSRESAAREYANGDVVDARTWFAVNPVYALGLGLE